MSYSIWRPTTSVLCAFLMIVTPLTLPGCGTGPTVVDILLSSAGLTPGQFLTISHPSITEGSLVNVEFRGPEEFLVIVEAFDTQDGSLTVAVPPFVDLTTGEFRAEEVSVSIDGVDSRQPLMLTDLVELEDIEPGAILAIVFEAAIDGNEATLSNLALIEAELQGDVDSTDAVAAISQEIQVLEDMITELNMTGELVIDLGDDGLVTLGSDELRTADRVLISLIAGVSEESNNEVVSKRLRDLKGVPGGAARRDIVECIQMPADATESKVECLKEVVSDVVSGLGQGTNLASMVVTGVGLVITVAGIIKTAPLIALTGLLVTVIGAATSYTNAAVNQQNSDAFLNNDGEGFDSGQEAASQLLRVGSSAASNVPVIGAPAQVVNVVLSVSDLLNGAKSVKCSSDQQKYLTWQEIPGLLEFCEFTTTPEGDDPVVDEPDPVLDEPEPVADEPEPVEDDDSDCPLDGFCSFICIEGTDPDCDLCGAEGTCIDHCLFDEDPDCSTEVDPPEVDPAEGFTVLGYFNSITGSFEAGVGLDLSGSPIQISGDPSRPTISWPGFDNVAQITVGIGARTVYGITAVSLPDDDDGDGVNDIIPFAFDSVKYGTYGLANTEALEYLSDLLGPADAIDLTPGTVVSITVTIFFEGLLTLSFEVN